MKRRPHVHAKPAQHLGSQSHRRMSAEAGSFGARELAAEVRRRFKSPDSGGRATDPRWTAKRLIPMRQDTLARLQELANEVSRRLKYRVEPLQLAAILIERQLAPASRTQGTREALRGFAKFLGKATWEGSLDDLRQSRVNRAVAPDRPSGLDLVRDLVGSVAGSGPVRRPSDACRRLLRGLRQERTVASTSRIAADPSLGRAFP
jgi:hypothetical protein